MHRYTDANTARKTKPKTALSVKRFTQEMPTLKMLLIKITKKNTLFCNLH